MRKRIGVLASEVEEIYQSKILHGIIEKCKELDYDTLIFSSFSKKPFFKQYEIGDRNIFNLINFEKLDGVIIVAETLKSHGLIEEITQKLKDNCTCPVVFIDSNTTEFSTVNVDDTLPFELLVDHVIDEHGCEKLMFLSGDENDVATQKRLTGYVNSLKKHGIEIDPALICFEGGFWTVESEIVGNQLAQGLRPMPQAIICASDYMAIGVINGLRNAGIRIPDDVIVVGYDATDDAAKFDLPITSYSPPIVAAGQNAVIVLDSQINNKSKVELVIGTGKVEIGSSCGCKEDSSYTRREFIYKQSDLNYHEFLESNIMEALAEAKGINDLLGTIQYYLYLIKDWNDFYLCLCENWLGKGTIYGDENYISHGYTENMVLNIKSENRYNRTFYQKFKSKDLLPALYDESKPCKAYYFTPVHFNAKCFGYAVLSYGDLIKSFGITYRNWTKHVNNALESMRMRIEIQNSALRDVLTGVYTRLGLEQNYKNLENRLSNTLFSTFVLVADVDGLKAINDKYGHSQGDVAINSVAKALCAAMSGYEICGRTGGDEFLVVGCNEYADDIVDKFTQKVNAYLDDINSGGENSFKITASLGGVCQRIDSLDELNVLYNKADELMYIHKNSKN